MCAVLGHVLELELELDEMGWHVRMQCDEVVHLGGELLRLSDDCLMCAVLVRVLIL